MIRWTQSPCSRFLQGIDNIYNASCVMRVLKRPNQRGKLLIQFHSDVTDFLKGAKGIELNYWDLTESCPSWVGLTSAQMM